MRSTAVLEKEDSLPRAEGEVPVVNRNDFTGSGQRHAQMAGTVIWTFVSMDEVGEILRDKVIKEGMEICSRLGICVLHDDEAAAGVANENSELSGLDAYPINKVANFAGDFIGAFAAGSDRELVGVGLERHPKGIR